MSQSNRSASSRKKLTKCSSTSTPNHNSNHKLKRISSTSTYLVDNEEELDDIRNTSYENTNIPLSESRRDVTRIQRRIDKTTSISTFNGGRKFWNCNAKPTSFYVPDNAVIQEESELIGALTKQLCVVETQLQKVQTNLRKNEEQSKLKDQEIIRLKRKVKEWENKSKNMEMLRKKEQQQRQIQTDHSEQLYERCLILERKIFEMEKFLADYGLIWVGDTNSPRCTDTIPNNPIEACYDQVIANIDQLNLAAGKGEVHVQHNEKGNGATFKTPSCMCLKFYKNGMIIQDGSLRPYNDQATMSFLRDILDGYFPSELQEAYPNGVPFKVEDHRNQMYLNNVEFPGQGYRLGKQLQIDNPSLPSKIRRPSASFQKSPHNVSNMDLSTHLTPLSVRSYKSKGSSDSPPLEMYVLRSQILASHNNICSNTHLQSHINAELSRSNRKEKRDTATRNTEFDVYVRETSVKSKGVLRFPSSGRCYHSSTDRSSSRLSPSRNRETPDDRFRHKSRSSSLPNARLSVNSKPAPKTKPVDSNNSNVSQMSNSQANNIVAKKNPRPTKSATPAPILHQINEPTGARGELRLKVRSLNGGTVYLVHVSADDPIARLYQLLDKAMTRTVPRGYKIVLSGYSPKRLEQLGTTLREIGITRDSVLHLVNV
ncbi:uncharacterized protein LOC117601701 isoform X2 [Osmia lignaria lignaria]|uniref:uncharacterized protein LOC117601701 isoform X2 n=1 Tax=Osmia lignaria lignaria TaxID=1437193 RepID=UPI00147912C9|nr:uncharacterized protein LOC117601701 isoform X2 [Osmia lignaria]